MDSCDHQVLSPRRRKKEGDQPVGAPNTHLNMRSPTMTSKQTDDSTTATTARIVVWSYVYKRFSTGRLSPWHLSPW
jgi:hypothetical protein